MSKIDPDAVPKNAAARRQIAQSKEEAAMNQRRESRGAARSAAALESARVCTEINERIQNAASAHGGQGSAEDESNRGPVAPDPETPTDCADASGGSVGTSPDPEPAEEVSEGKPCAGCMGQSSTHACDTMKGAAVLLGQKEPLSDERLDEWLADEYFRAWLKRQPIAFENFVVTLIAALRSAREERDMKDRGWERADQNDRRACARIAELEADLAQDEAAHDAHHESTLKALAFAKEQIAALARERDEEKAARVKYQASLRKAREKRDDMKERLGDAEHVLLRDNDKMRDRCRALTREWDEMAGRAQMTGIEYSDAIIERDEARAEVERLKVEHNANCQRCSARLEELGFITIARHEVDDLRARIAELEEQVKNFIGLVELLQEGEPVEKQIAMLTRERDDLRERLRAETKRAAEAAYGDAKIVADLRAEVERLRDCDVLCGPEQDCCYAGRLKVKLAKAKEQHRMELVAISTVAMQMQNSKRSEAPLPKDHQYWTPSYGDVQDAVGREIDWRGRADAGEAREKGLRDALVDGRDTLQQVLEDSAIFICYAKRPVCCLDLLERLRAALNADKEGDDV